MTSGAQHEFDFTAPALVAVWQKRALMVGIVFSILSIIGWILEAGQFYRSFLLAYMLCFGLTIGSLAVLMLYHLTGGAWGAMIRRTLEAATRTMPMMIVLFVPIVIGIHRLYSWSRPEVVANDENLQHTAHQYLNLRLFLTRAVLYFIVWMVLVRILNKLSDRQDQLPEIAMDQKYRRIGGAGLVIYGFTITFAAVDWVMSLDPHWVSTIYGLLFVAGQGMIAFSFATIMAAVLVRYAPMKDILKPDQFLDLGKLMLTFVMLWGYFALSQWLIIWSGNLPDEITWYLNRTRGGWEYVGFILICGQFAIPFFLLLSHSLKSNAQFLMKLGLWLILMRYLDLFWFIMPNFPDRHGHFHYSWLDAVVPIAMGALWLAVFFYNLRTRPLMAVHDPHVRLLLEEGHEHEQRRAS